jgi:ubiquinone/menaquinone biosynthesis C-methylase UbiE
MNHADHVRLIEPGITRNGGGVWADLGAGTGAFTLALRDIAGPEVEIVAVDRDRRSLQTLRAAMDDAFPGTRLHLVEADFTAPLDLSGLDGIVIANALHYVRDQRTFLRSLRSVLSPAGRLIVVEYDTDRGNHWVPHPLSARSLVARVQEAGFRSPVLLGRVPSRFLGSIYAVSAQAQE